MHLTLQVRGLREWPSFPLNLMGGFWDGPVQRAIG